jgi:hypothetical protein
MSEQGHSPTTPGDSSENLPIEPSGITSTITTASSVETLVRPKPCIQVRPQPVSEESDPEGGGLQHLGSEAADGDPRPQAFEEAVRPYALIT